MNRRETIKTLALGALRSQALLEQLGAKQALSLQLPPLQPPPFVSDWSRWPDVRWSGPRVWGNRLQDWQIRNGALACTARGPNRTLHCLTHRLGEAAAFFEATVRIEQMEAANSKTGYAGFRLGARGPFADYRSAAVFGEGLDAGLWADGTPFVGETEGSGDEAVRRRMAAGQPVRLRLRTAPQGAGFTLALDVLGEEEDAPLAHLAVDDVSGEELVGNVALVSHFSERDASESDASEPGSEEPDYSDVDSLEEALPEAQKVPVVQFGRWQMDGDKLLHDPEATYGPVMFAQYTPHRGTLKLTAQLAPVEQIEGAYAVLETRDPGSGPGPYRVRLVLPLKEGTEEFFYEGTIAREPATGEPLTLAVFSCNADHGFPDADVVDHVRQHRPDAAVFLGDQFYEGSGGFGVERSPVEEAALDMLRKWYLFGWSYREIYRDIPAAVIPDDHDVYHGNVWGEGGADAPVEEKGWGYGSQDAGGYKMPPMWINAMQRAQTSHLPDPYDATPVKAGHRNVLHRLVLRRRQLRPPGGPQVQVGPAERAA